MKNKLNTIRSLILTSTFMALPMAAQAGTLVTDTSQMPGIDGVVDFSDKTSSVFTVGPEQVGSLIGEDIEFTASGPSGGFSFPSYGLVDNGTWGPNGFTYAFIDNGLGSWVRFEFNDGPVSAVGGFVNYAICGSDVGCGSGPFSIRAYDASMNLLDQFTVSTDAPISTPLAENDGAFRGIVRTTADIAVFEIEGGVAVIDDLTFFRGMSDPCDLDGDGDFDNDDIRLFVSGCRGGTISDCDKNGDGALNYSDVLIYARSCRATPSVLDGIEATVRSYSGTGTQR